MKNPGVMVFLCILIDMYLSNEAASAGETVGSSP